MSSQSEPELPQLFLDRLYVVKNKRARVVIDHILQHGSISTEELKAQYGYNHPPRAAKDVRDEGIPLITFATKGSDGRTIAAYKFGDPATAVSGREGGRRAFARKFKLHLYELAEHRCGICRGQFELRELQIDHRIPYEIMGEIEQPEQHPTAFMLVCGSCNRAKSWSCEHCANWETRNPDVCKNCYWASPTEYAHIALRPVRRTDILWEGEEVETHNRLQKASEDQHLSIQEYIKRLLRQVVFLILILILFGLILVFVFI
jgi:hypothetical protein